MVHWIANQSVQKLVGVEKYLVTEFAMKRVLQKNVIMMVEIVLGPNKINAYESYDKHSKC